jgi:predicted dehydrogenase
MGKVHAEQMIHAGMEFVAACDLDPARMEAAKADFPGIRTYTSPQALAEDDAIDLAVVILPHNLHAPVAIDLLNKGKHVVVEKPMCLNVAEATAMIEAADAAGRMLSIFHNRRWDGDYTLIRQTLADGTIGDAFHFETCMGGYHKPGDWWRSDKTISGGAMFDWGAHIIDWILQLVPERVAGVDGYYHKRHWTHTNEDHTELMIRFESGKTAQVEISSLAAFPKDRWRILGTKGAMRVYDWNKVEVAVEVGGNVAKYQPHAPKDEWQGYYNNVAGHLMRGEDLVVKATEGRRTIGVIEAAERSSELQRTVVPDFP